MQYKGIFLYFGKSMEYYSAVLIVEDDRATLDGIKLYVGERQGAMSTLSILQHILTLSSLFCLSDQFLEGHRKSEALINEFLS